jgi:hypothetical protein
MTVRWSRGAVLLVLFGLAGCVSPRLLRRDRAAPVAVEVVNHNRRDAAIYWWSGSMRIRLGTTTSGGNSRFMIRDTRQAGLLDVAVSAEVIGSDRGYLTPRIAVRPGETIEIRLEDLLTSSSYAVRPAPDGPIKPR